MVAVNIKRLDSESYRTYRVLRANPVMSDLYRRRVKDFGNVRGALIFPEALLSLTSPIYAVALTADSSTHRAGVTVVSSKAILTHDGCEIRSIEQIHEAEASVFTEADAKKLFKLPGSGYGAERFFTDNVIFTNREAVMKYVINRFPALLDTLKG